MFFIDLLPNKDTDLSNILQILNHMQNDISYGTGLAVE